MSFEFSAVVSGSNPAEMVACSFIHPHNMNEDQCIFIRGSYTLGAKAMFRVIQARKKSKLESCLGRLTCCLLQFKKGPQLYLNKNKKQGRC